MNELIHIVCLDAPSPPDYGGGIDMYYKIKSLGKAGKKIILHYFDYNKDRGHQGLEQYCAEINTYKRKGWISAVSLTQPYIVASRVNDKLITRLNEDEHPIILEGVHCTGIIPYLKKKQRIIIRMHNDEASYYNHLALSEKGLLKKAYFKWESNLLAAYQDRLNKNIKVACLSEWDKQLFDRNYRFKSTHFIPCFISWQEISIKAGRGQYCLYHGNMSVSENEEACTWLIENVFSKVDIPFTIAGKGVSNKLATLAKPFQNITIVPDPSISEINQLIADAHINVIPSMNNTGVKLKLLHALFRGRYCITNNKGIKGSSIKEGVLIANTPSEYFQLIPAVMSKDFSPDLISRREELLNTYNNSENANKIIELL